jgi:hypothetical protein
MLGENEIKMREGRNRFRGNSSMLSFARLLSASAAVKKEHKKAEMGAVFSFSGPRIPTARERERERERQQQQQQLMGERKAKLSCGGGGGGGGNRKSEQNQMQQQGKSNGP